MKPEFSGADAIEIAKKYYNIHGSIKEFPSYEDQNFYIKSNNNNEFVLRISIKDENLEQITLENKVIAFLNSESSMITSKLILNKNGDEITSLKHKNRVFLVRLVSYLPGRNLSEFDNLSLDDFFHIGKCIGSFSKILNTFKYKNYDRKFKWNFKYAFETISSKFEFVQDKHQKNIIKTFRNYYLKHVLTFYDDLKSGIIHNDWNDNNIILNQKDSNELSIGIIDFGDLHYGIKISELAVALTYLMIDKDDPLLIAFHVVKGFNSEFLLEEIELKVLFPLICTRIALSLSNSNHQRILDPDNSYISISEQSMINLAQKFQNIPLEFAEQTFKDACDQGMSVDDILQLRVKFLGKNLSVSYQHPLKITRGLNQFLYDYEGKKYLDCVNNIFPVGYSNQEITKVLTYQSSVLNTNTRYLHESIVQYAQRLCNTLPEPLTVCYFVNSGSEANELALRLALQYTQQEEIIVLEGAYHGNTKTLVSISPYKFTRKGGFNPPSNIHTVPAPDTYRGEFKKADPNSGAKYAKFVKNKVDELVENGRKCPVFISESIMGSGGQIIYPEKYFSYVYEYIRSNGGICIADEVQTGFGRVGTHFWGFETQNVVPDIVTIGKPIGNGHPIGAVITTREIADTFNNGMEFFSSFGGNPVACQVGMKVLDIIERENLQENAKIVGEFLLKELSLMKEKFTKIGDVRGLGLFLGIEFVEDRVTLVPAKNYAKQVVENMKDEGFLLSVDGMNDNVIKIKPPLIFTLHDAQSLIEKFNDILSLME